MKISEQLFAAAREAVLQADRLDARFLGEADARAVQGGAICEGAQSFRSYARTIRTIARDVAVAEEEAGL